MQQPSYQRAGSAFGVSSVLSVSLEMSPEASSDVPQRQRNPISQHLFAVFRKTPFENFPSLNCEAFPSPSAFWSPFFNGREDRTEKIIISSPHSSEKPSCETLSSFLFGPLNPLLNRGLQCLHFGREGKLERFVKMEVGPLARGPLINWPFNYS